MKFIYITMLFVILAFTFGCQERKGNPSAEIGENAATNVENSELANTEDTTVRAQIPQSEIAIPTDFEEEASVQQVYSSPPNSPIASIEQSGSENLNFSEETKNSSFLNNLPMLGSLALNLILFLLLLKTVKSNNKHKKEAAELSKGKEFYKLNYNQSLRNIESLKKESENRFKDGSTVKPKKEVINNTVKEFHDYERPVEYVFNNIQPQKSKPEPQEIIPEVILYAGKPSDANTFSAVSSEQDVHRSIFKLILENKEADKAKFEVIENDYILKMAANSPDTYLYHICKPENSNQNFDGRIVTTEKGTAHLVDGKWKVNDEDKATIKFQ